MTWPTKTDFVDGDVLTAAQVNNIGTNLNEADPTGITDGYVLTADGSGGMGWEAVSAGSYTTLASGSLSGSSLDLTSISQSYKDLVLLVNMMRPNATNNWKLNVNNLTGGSYMRAGQSASTNYANGSATYVQLDAGNWSSGYYMNLVFIFDDYATSKYPSGRVFVSSSNQSSVPGGYWTWQYSGTQAAINRVTFASASGATFLSGTYELLGVN